MPRDGLVAATVLLTMERFLVPPTVIPCQVSVTTTLLKIWDAVPEPVKDGDAVEVVGRHRQARPRLGDDLVIVDDDIGIGDRGVVPGPSLDAIGVNADIVADVMTVGDAVVFDADMAA